MANHILGTRKFKIDNIHRFVVRISRKRQLLELDSDAIYSPK